MSRWHPYVFWTGLLLCGLAWWRGAPLPERGLLFDELLEEPRQTPVRVQPFQVRAAGITYTVNPLFRYELDGLVVSRHNADTWWDFAHRDWKDALNVTDLCVVWGNNVRSDVYRRLEYWSGQFTCNFRTDSAEVFAAFDPSALSNNHLLSDRARLVRVMKNVRVGDQIRFSGYLAEYSHNQGFPFRRGTSIVRTDTGNGACETVYVEDFRILRKGDRLRTALWWLSGILMVLGIAGWLKRPYVPPED